MAQVIRGLTLIGGGWGEGFGERDRTIRHAESQVDGKQHDGCVWGEGGGRGRKGGNRKMFGAARSNSREAIPGPFRDQ